MDKRDPQHPGTDIGLLSFLHSGTKLEHPHIHCNVPAGGLAQDRSGWIAAPKLPTFGIVGQAGFRHLDSAH